MKQYKVIISGGGTGGHIFPAISIANTLKKRMPDVQILFVGAQDRMEMDKVPAAGYEIVGLPVKGFDRAHLLNNIKVVRCLLKSLSLAKKRYGIFSLTSQLVLEVMPVVRRCG